MVGCRNAAVTQRRGSRTDSGRRHLEDYPQSIIFLSQFGYASVVENQQTMVLISTPFDLAYRKSSLL